MLKAMALFAALAGASPAMATDWVLVGTGGEPGNMAGFIIDRDSITAPTPETRKASMAIIGYHFTAHGTIEIECATVRWRSLSSEVAVDGSAPVQRGVEQWNDASAVPNMGAMVHYACAEAAGRGAIDVTSMGGGDPVAPVRARLKEME